MKSDCFRTYWIALAAAALWLDAMPAGAQTTQIVWSAFTTGYGVSASATSAVTSVVGQPLVGTSSGGTDNIGSGFLADPTLGGTVTAVTDQPPVEVQLPQVFELQQNYPNPFNPATRIGFSLPHTSEVRLTIYDLLGRQVVTLLQSQQAAGYHTVDWNGRDASGNPVGNGTYFYRLEAGEFKVTKKLLLLK